MFPIVPIRESQGPLAPVDADPLGRRCARPSRAERKGNFRSGSAELGQRHHTECALMACLGATRARPLSAATHFRHARRLMQLAGMNVMDLHAIPPKRPCRRWLSAVGPYEIYLGVSTRVSAIVRQRRSPPRHSVRRPNAQSAPADKHLAAHDAVCRRAIVGPLTDVALHHKIEMHS